MADTSFKVSELLRENWQGVSEILTKLFSQTESFEYDYPWNKLILAETSENHKNTLRINTEYEWLLSVFQMLECLGIWLSGTDRVLSISVY